MDCDHDSGAITAVCGGCMADPELDPEFEVKVMAWGCLLAADPSLAALDEDLTPGSWHWRGAPGQPWVVEPGSG